MDDNWNADQRSKAADEAKGRLAAATETVSDLAGKAGAAAAGAAGAGAQAADYLSHKTAEQPLPALLIAAAIGFSIAYLLFRREASAPHC